MANAISLITKYLAVLDEIYQFSSKTAILDATKTMIQAGSEANKVKIAKIALQGLGDYDRNTGYVSGDVTLTWEEHTFSQDRGRTFTIDAVDNIESANLAFGKVSGEFVRTKSTPEFDAYRMAAYQDGAGTKVSADLSTGALILAAIDVATGVMDDAEVPEEGRLLYIANAKYNLLKAEATIQRRIGDGNDGTFDRRFRTFDGMTLVKMPKTRFYTAITQYDGSTPGQEAGGYIKDAAGYDGNFLMMHPSSIMQTMKHAVTKIISPEVNQDSDGWKYYFRAYHDAWVLENKTDGLYSHYHTS